MTATMKIAAMTAPGRQSAAPDIGTAAGTITMDVQTVMMWRPVSGIRI